MLVWLLIAGGGALGAVSRFAVDRAVVGLLGPTVLGTFIANISGSFLLGLFLAAMDGRLVDVPELRALVAVGFLGSYTTFSALTVSSVQLAGEGDWLHAAANILGSLTVGVIAAFAGIVVGRVFLT